MNREQAQDLRDLNFHVPRLLASLQNARLVKIVPKVGETKLTKPDSERNWSPLMKGLEAVNDREAGSHEDLSTTQTEKIMSQTQQQAVKGPSGAEGILCDG